LIEKVNASVKPVLSLDIPSGLDATSGDTPGVCIQAEQTLTLALPKPGLANLLSGEIYLADIGIPPEVYHPLGIRFAPFFNGKGIIALEF
jgi:NAD(P)H-hydrate epimerase